MAKIDLSALESEDMIGSLKGQKIMLYGDNDTGKTTQAMRMEKPLLLMAEAGGNALSGKKQPITSWFEFKQVVEQLTTSNSAKFDMMKEKYQTIIIDTVEALVTLCEQSVCKEYGVRDLSEMQTEKGGEKLPNGYNLYRTDFKMCINKLANYGYTIVFISHEETVVKQDELDPDKKFEFVVPFGSENRKASTHFVRSLCDFVFYLRPNGIDTETQKTILSTAICKRTKHVFARSRYTTMPTFITVFTAENMEQTIIKAIEDKAKEENIGLKEFEIKLEGNTLQECQEIIAPYFRTLYKFYPDAVIEIVERQLGEGVKISQANENQTVELETIYKNLFSMANERGIEIEIEG